MQIARVYVRFFKKWDIVHGTFAKFMMEDGTFTQYKRFWYPAGYWKYDDDRIVFTSECAFVIITAIGLEEIGMELGEMDAWMTMGGVPDVGNIVSHFKESGVIIALFLESGEDYVFTGEVDTSRISEILKPKNAHE